MPHATEEVLWGNDLVFKIGGRNARHGISPAPRRAVGRTPGGDATLPVQSSNQSEPKMTVLVKPKTELVVPSSLQRQAGIKTGDRLEFKVSPGTITITTAAQPTYKPTKAELAAIRKGEAAIAKGNYVTLTELSNDLDRHRRKAGTKAARKVSR